MNLLVVIILFLVIFKLLIDLDIYLLQRRLWKEELKSNPPHPLGRNILLENAIADAKTVRMTSLLQAKLAKDEIEKHL
jgi:hypothetical protein